MEVENKPQPLAGFSVGTVSPYKRAPQVKRKPVDQLFRKSTESEKFVRFEYEESVPPPPLVRKLTPMSELLESMMETDNSRTDTWQTASFFEEIPPPPISRQLTPMSNLLESLLEATPKKGREEELHYFPIEVDVGKLVDWKEKIKQNKSEEQNKSNISSFARYMMNQSPTADKELPEKRVVSETKSHISSYARYMMSQSTPESKDVLKKAALVNVNNTDVALFKYGDQVIGKT